MARHGKYQIRHSQNYLVNKKLVDQLVTQASIGPDDTVVEIGPGKGIITRALARKAGHVIAIEKDERLANELAKSIPGNVTIYGTDALSFPIPATPYRVFANIPFRHTAAIVGKLTTGTAPPFDVRLVVQREAAERFMVGPESTMRAQQLYPIFDVRILHTFDRLDFSPAPSIECVLMQISRKYNPDFPMELAYRYTQLIEVVFSAWQPTLEAVLKTTLPRLAAQHVNADRMIRESLSLKPSEVSPQTWMRMFELLVDRDDDRVWREIGIRSSRLEANRGQLDRPTRTGKGGRKPRR